MLSKNDSFFEKIFSSPPWTRCFQTPSLPCFLLISFRAFLAYFLIFFTVAIILCNDVSNPRHAPHSGALTSVLLKRDVRNSKTFCMVIFDKRTKHSFFAFRFLGLLFPGYNLYLCWGYHFASIMVVYFCVFSSLQYLKKGTP